LKEGGQISALSLVSWGLGGEIHNMEYTSNPSTTIFLEVGIHCKFKLINEDVFGKAGSVCLVDSWPSFAVVSTVFLNLKLAKLAIEAQK
jgi:hypothetical protein